MLAHNWIQANPLNLTWVRLWLTKLIIVVTRVSEESNSPKLIGCKNGLKFVFDSGRYVKS